MSKDEATRLLRAAEDEHAKAFQVYQEAAAQHDSVLASMYDDGWRRNEDDDDYYPRNPLDEAEREVHRHQRALDQAVAALELARLRHAIEDAKEFAHGLVKASRKRRDKAAQALRTQVTSAAGAILTLCIAAFMAGIVSEQGRDSLSLAIQLSALVGGVFLAEHTIGIAVHGALARTARQVVRAQEGDKVSLRHKVEKLGQGTTAFLTWLPTRLVLLQLALLGGAGFHFVRGVVLL